MENFLLNKIGKKGLIFIFYHFFKLLLIRSFERHEFNYKISISFDTGKGNEKVRPKDFSLLPISNYFIHSLYRSPLLPIVTESYCYLRYKRYINFFYPTLNICSKGSILRSVTLVTQVTVKFGKDR